MTVSTQYSAFSQLVIPVANSPTADLQTTMVLTQVCSGLATWTLRVANALNKLMPAGAVVPVSQGGTGLSSGNSGGIPYFNSTTTMASSASLLLNGLVIGGGAGGAPSTASDFTITNSDACLTGNANATSFVNGNVSDMLQLQQVDGTGCSIRLNSFLGTVNHIVGQAAGNTAASPSAVAGQVLMQVVGIGFDGTGWSSRAGEIDISPITSPWTISDHSTRVQIFTTPVASITEDTTACFTASSQGCAIKGTNTNDSAAAGFVGEYASTITLIASEVSINGPANVCTLSLTAGDWDVIGELWVDTATGAATVNGRMQASITQTTATQASVPSDSTAKAAYDALPLVSTTASVVLPVGPVRQSLSGTTNIFLVGSCGTSAGTAFGYGKLSARRRR
jgi:hypothetical protein